MRTFDDVELVACRLADQTRNTVGDATSAPVFETVWNSAKIAINGQVLARCCFLVFDQVNGL